MASYLSSAAGGWKQPLKGVRRTAAALPCLHPAPAARRSSSPQVADEDVWSFCSLISDEVGALERSLDEGSVSLRWSAEAMRVLKRMQVELLALFRRSGLPASFGAKDGWFDQYMEETALLLDLCNHLKSVAAGISRYRMVVDLAIHKVQNGSTPEFEALETEHKKLLEATKRKQTTTTPTATTTAEDATAPAPVPIKCDNSTIGVAMLAARCATVAISLILVSAFVSPVTVDMGDEQIAREFPQLRPLAALLASLVGRFKGSCGGGGGSGLVLAEHELVRESVEDLRSQLEKGKAEEEVGKRVELLRQRSEGLKEGIEAFDSAVDEVFDEMIKGRNELLGTFRDSSLT